MTSLKWLGPALLYEPEICRIPGGVAGVYALHVYARSYGGYPVFYVGKSLDLRRRLLEHLSPSRKTCVRRVRLTERVYFSLAVVPLAYLDRVESVLIRTFRPLCNDQVPAAEPLLVNLPTLSFRRNE